MQQDTEHKLALRRQKVDASTLVDKMLYIFQFRAGRADMNQAVDRAYRSFIDDPLDMLSPLEHADEIEAVLKSKESANDLLTSHGTSEQDAREFLRSLVDYIRDGRPKPKPPLDEHGELPEDIKTLVVRLLVPFADGLPSKQAVEGLAQKIADTNEEIDGLHVEADHFLRAIRYSLQSGAKLVPLTKARSHLTEEDVRAYLIEIGRAIRTFHRENAH